ncbi:hypothetical protein [Streptomyces sp. NPDC058457]|uniref:hypothetical protein n=1 Tax=Streptomyces sp. NPDC058457 TaxID=3346507 RepID=UPI0036612122
MLAHMYVQHSPAGYVLILVVASPLALAALVFWALMVIPPLRKYGPRPPKGRIEKAANVGGCSLATLVLVALVALGIWGLFDTL